jgi:hypothetical protein
LKRKDIELYNYIKGILKWVKNKYKKYWKKTSCQM